MKKKQKKNKNKVLDPPPDPNELVTELEKQTFEIQLVDIATTIDRLIAKQEELRLKTVDIDDKIEDYKKENGAIISEEEQILMAKENEKIKKREESILLGRETKIRTENYKKQILELEKKYKDVLAEKTKEIETLNHEARSLDEFKQNKDSYMGVLEKLKKRMAESEVEHQRILFNIENKGNLAKVRLVKELETRLLSASLDFQQTYQKEIGDSCRRITLENKAIESELGQVREELEDCRSKYEIAVKNLRTYKANQKNGLMEKDKALARALLQMWIIQSLNKDRIRLLQHLGEYEGMEKKHKNLTRRLRIIEAEKHRQMMRTREIMKAIEDKIEETKLLKDASKALNGTSKKLQTLIRTALKVLDDTGIVRSIPGAAMEEDKYLTNEAKIRLFRKRRESVFRRKGKMLQYLFDSLSKAQLTEEELNLLKTTSTESVNVENLDFSSIYGKPFSEIEKESREVIMRQSDNDKLLATYLLTSETSLPRSISDVFEARVEEEESAEGEMYEYYGESYELKPDEIQGFEEGSENEESSLGSDEKALQPT